MFSEANLEMINWYAEKAGARSLASVKQVKRDREVELQVAGLSTDAFNGELGDVYATNNIKHILAHVRASETQTSMGARTYVGNE